LLRIIRDGLGAIAPGYESDMPVFGETLSDAEIMSILGFFKQGWPERERRYQQERTRRYAGPPPLNGCRGAFAAP
jgi:hypothetical protein|tara:strand:- start:126185 stop:126409 length:225 start_codon:yes stop_codon:yes gene_type:complete